MDSLLEVDTGDPESDRRARTLNAIILVAIPSALVTALVVLPFREGPQSAATMVIAASGLIGVLGLSHSGRLAAAVTMFAVLLWVLTVIQPAITGDLSVNTLLVLVSSVMLVYVVTPARRPLLVAWVISALAVLLLTTNDTDTVPVTRLQWVTNTGLATAVILTVVIYGARQLALSVRRERRLVAQLSASERTLRRLRELARTDPLTGFLNRRALETDFPQLAPVTAVALIDLDRFKGVNDEYSHAVGDQLLADVSGLLAGAAHDADQLYRLGGDEFLVVRQSARAADLATWLHSVRSQLRATEWSGLADHTVTFSGGVVDVAGEDFLATLSRVDRAMYAAKEAGRDAIVVID